MDTTQKPITSLTDLTKLTKASLSGGLGSQEFFYKADEVEALVAHLTIVPADDNALGFAKQELSAIRINHPGGFVGFVPQGPVEQYVAGLLVRVRNLQAFKEYVHHRFDEANIDRHEEQNATTGCRVGARFDDLERFMAMTDSQKAAEAFVAVANGLAEAIDKESIQMVYEVWQNITEVLITKDVPTIGVLEMILSPGFGKEQSNA